MSCTECGSSEGRIIKYKYGAPYCWTHYLQMNRHGRILLRTKYTPNTFIDKGDYCEVVLYAENGQERGRALIDKTDFPRVSERKWSVAQRKGGKMYAASLFPTRVLLHVFILGKEAGKEIDHKDNNGLNCRRSNLRHLTHHQNILNKRQPKSGRTGVYWRNRKDGPSCWVASIMINGKHKRRHCHTFEEAVAIRRQMELKHVGLTTEEILQG